MHRLSRYIIPVMTAQEQSEIFNFLQTAAGWIDGYRSYSPVPEFKDKADPLTHEQLESGIQTCTRCPLSVNRVPVQNKHTSGCIHIPVQAIVITFKPTGSETLINGPREALLERMLAAIQLDTTENCCLTTVLKCPSGLSDAAGTDTRGEGELLAAESCLPWIESQIQTFRPRAVLILGTAALQALGYKDHDPGTVHGQTLNLYGIPALAAWEPADILRDASLKRPVWEVLQRLRQILDQQDSGISSSSGF